MIREYPNGDKAEIKGLTVTVELGEESIGRIRKAALDEIDSLKAENAKLRELVREMYGATLVSCGECWIGKAFDPAECDNENCGNRKNYLAMRELGIEVDYDKD